MIRVFWIVVLLLVGGCATPGVKSGLTPVPQRVASRMAGRVCFQLPAVEAVSRSLAYVRSRNPQERPFVASGLDCSWDTLKASLEHLQAMRSRLLADPELLAREFDWYEVDPQPLVTGYYEPELQASLVPDPAYPVPVYGLPESLKIADLGRFLPRFKGQEIVYRIDGDHIEPFYTREEIDCFNAMNAAPIAWARDEVDVFFLQIQGSGLLRLPDGGLKHILYAGKNGHEYVSLGKVMIERGLIAKEQVSMQTIRSVLAVRPDIRQELLNTNPSYVFFRLADDGPYGSTGQTLTPMVSMASDSAFLPQGTILAADLDLPVPDGGAERTSFIGLPQDRGGSIKGSRLDLFCGSGERAAFVAGNLKARGRIFLLLKHE